MSPPNFLLRALDLSVEQMRAVTSMEVQTHMLSDWVEHLPFVLVNVSAPAPISNAPDAWGASFTLTLTVMAATRQEAMNETYNLANALLASYRDGTHTLSGWFSHLRTLELPAFASSNGEGLWAATCALDAVARH